MAHYASTIRDPQKTDVLFVVGDVHYAVGIRKVAELVCPYPVTPLPHAPAEISGVADHRGEVIPVLDLRAYFALPPVPPTRSTRWILVNTGNRLLGLVVDRVIEVIGLKSDDPRHTPAVGAGRERRGILTVTQYNNALVFVLDIKRFAEIVDEIDDILPPYQG